jgi:nitrite reductase/ring-hydroxylating ferredoxin subunit
MNQTPKNFTTGTRLIEIALADIPAHRPMRFEAGETGVVVVRTEQGVCAFEDSCPHAQWRLSDGDVIGNVLECPGHGWEFDASTGRCLNVPAYCLKRYPVTTEDGQVRIEIGGGRTPAAEEREEQPGPTVA